MARRGGRRTYVRDGRGRFASTPGGGKKAPSGLPSRQPRMAGSPPQRRRGLVLQRASAKRSKAKLAAMDPQAGSYSASLKRRAQKAAVTRTGNKLQAARKSGTIRLGARAGVIKPGKDKPKTPTLAERKRANALKKGLLSQTTEADRRSRAQSLAREERKLAEMMKKPPRNVFGIDRNAIALQKAHVERLREPLPAYRRRELSAIRQAARDNLARKRAGREAALRLRKRSKSYDVAQRASAYYRKTGTLPASQRKPGTRAKPKPGFKQSPSLARGERILSRLQAIGKGKSGRKARQSQIVRDRAASFYRAVAPSSVYERGAKAGQARPSVDVLSGLAKNLGDKERIKKAQQVVGRGPASGIRQRLEQQGRRKGARGDRRLETRVARNALGSMSDSQYRQSLAFGGRRPSNKIETAIAVRRRAMEFLANPRSGQKLPALSRPVPQRRATASSPKPPQPAPKREGVKLSYSQRLRAESAKRFYGVKRTGKKWATRSTGERIRTTGRTLRQAAKRQTQRAINTTNFSRTIGEGDRPRYRQRTFRGQLNLLTGKVDTTYGKFRKLDRSKAKPSKKAKLGVRRAQR